MCVCRDKRYTTDDVIDSAVFRGELDQTWKQFLLGMKAEARAEELGLELDHDAIDTAAESFRYYHDLITAEETEQWLTQRGLTLNDFIDYFVRQYWRASPQEKIQPNEIDLVSASRELRELFTAELIFSGELQRLNTQLMWRLAAFAATDEGNIDPKQINAERRAFLARIAAAKTNVDDWLAQIDRGNNWVDEMLAMEVAYRSACEKVLTPGARRKQLSTLRMPLTQFEAEVIELESPDAAKEALFCIREDGMSMEQVAAEARYPYRRITLWHEDIPPELQHKFWSAGMGDLLEPLPRGDGFELYRITKKDEPDLTNPIVQERIDEHLLNQHFSALTREHVELRLGAPVSAK
jgi:hypothetical protein